MNQAQDDQVPVVLLFPFQSWGLEHLPPGGWAQVTALGELVGFNEAMARGTATAQEVPMQVRAMAIVACGILDAERRATLQRFSDLRQLMQRQQDLLEKQAAEIQAQAATIQELQARG